MHARAEIRAELRRVRIRTRPERLGLVLKPAVD
jgi:hypothetical protein